MPSNTPEYSRTHHQMNKKLFIICECGKRVSKPNLCSHLTTKCHTDFLFIKNGGVVEPIEEDTLIDCIHCGCLGILKSKMDLHLISVKCKKTTKLIKSIQHINTDEIDRDIQNMLLSSIEPTCKIVKPKDVVISYTKHFNENTQINTENWVYDDGSTGEKISYFLEERQIYTRTYMDGFKNVSDYRRCNQWQPSIYVIPP